ncbi:MAG: hypothetical protein EA001_07660 [Oscillatoriales cyanobacterium]|nr:MAG: hypothetical protein EA001_07660 [Oscillatoriales cyanobacterium]
MNTLGLLVGLALYQGLKVANRYSLPINNLAHLAFPQQTSWTILAASAIYLAVVYFLLSIAQQRYQSRQQDRLEVDEIEAIERPIDLTMTPISMSDRPDFLPKRS